MIKNRDLEPDSHTIFIYYECVCLFAMGYKRPPQSYKRPPLCYMCVVFFLLMLFSKRPPQSYKRPPLCYMSCILFVCVEDLVGDMNKTKTNID